MTAMTVVIEGVAWIVALIAFALIAGGIVLVVALWSGARTVADRARREYRQRTKLSTSWEGEKEGGLT